MQYLTSFSSIILLLVLTISITKALQSDINLPVIPLAPVKSLEITGKMP